ncbi:hypothetical protein ACHQM5_005713 [Ranunculus cassubicifolius]
MASNLPNEIMADILSRLPPKSLARFRLVSKNLCSLICDSYFVSMHLNRSIESGSSNLLLPCQYSSLLQLHTYSVDGYSFDKAHEIENPFDLSLSKYRVLGSCNGLVCFINCDSVCLLNPSIREYKVVKFARKFDLRHPDSMEIVYGFGYDLMDKDFKLVEIVYGNVGLESNCDFDVKITVYSLSDTSFSFSTQCTTPYKIFDEQDLGIYLNGALHWTAVNKHTSIETIFSFDIGGKVFREIPLPNSLDKLASINAGVLQGKLCMLVKKGCMEMDIWVMRSYGVRESWSKLYSVNQPGACLGTSHCSFCFTNNGEKVILKDTSDRLLYDPIQKTVKNLEIPGVFDWKRIDKIVSHVASLIPLKSNPILGKNKQW